MVNLTQKVKYAISNPIPLMAIPDSCEKIEAGGWEVVQLMIVGAGQSPIQLPGQQGLVPAVCVVARKYYTGDPPEALVIE